VRILVTGSSGHLGEALVRSLRMQGHEVIGLDVLPAKETTVVGSIQDQDLVQRCLKGVDAVMHSATLHKPHVVTHSMQNFIDVNLSGTLTLLEAAAAERVGSFVFSSTTSTFGDALAPPLTEAAAWITEEVMPQPKNIYGVSKCAAEDLCQLFSRNHGLACVVLKLSRFFPETDDDAKRAEKFDLLNLQINELLNRRVDIADVVSAHVLAMEAAPRLGFAKVIISATSPFMPADLVELRGQAASVLRKRVPAFEAVYQAKAWKMLDDVDRVYVNAKARKLLNWQPKYDFCQAIAALAKDEDPRSSLAQSIPMKGYHR
jgi:UDP-glucose 4-epimerase